MTRPTLTVGFSSVYNGWTVMCSECRSCIGTHGKRADAEAQAEGHRLMAHRGERS